jgi:hypothetical protein
MIGKLVRLVALFFLARRILRLASQRQVASKMGQ